MRFPYLLPDFNLDVSVMIMLMFSEGMSVVCSGTQYKPLDASYMACPNGSVV